MIHFTFIDVKAPEKREKKCEKYFCKSATQTMRNICLPNALLLHLRRFIVEVSPTYSVSYCKNQTAVEFKNNNNNSKFKKIYKFIYLQ